MAAAASKSRRRSLSDPLAAALLPPPNESPLKRELRMQAEEKAKKISDDIDEMIKAERMEKKKSRFIRVLLLGQSESGKSTTLKQFQLLHTPAAFHAERIAWRFVIYLNLVRSVRRVLEATSPELEAFHSHAFDDIDDDSADAASVIISPHVQSSPASHHFIKAYEKHQTRLAPLVQLEERLMRQLSEEELNEEREPTRLGTPNGHWHPFPSSRELPPLPISDPAHLRELPSHTHHTHKSTRASPISPLPELSVRTTSNWKKALALSGMMKSPNSPHSGELVGWWEDPDDPVHIINHCGPAMHDLWTDPLIKQRLAEKRLRLEESGGFYLNDIFRITAIRYIPTDADVLKARLKTTGVIEHTFTVKGNDFRGNNWKIYDVGGSRNQRQCWAPYFDDVNGIIFLAPISTFDQNLSEDRRINRLEDSLLLWKSVVSNKLLANVNIVLFLNKCDLLQAKLEAGVKLNEFMLSYGDRPNDYDSVSKYFRNKFGALNQNYSPNKEREVYIHLTAVTDTRRTHTIITSVRDFILRENLKIGGYM